LTVEALVVAEHRLGSLRDVTYELLNLPLQFPGIPATVCALLGFNVDDLANELARYSDEVLYLSNEYLKHFNSEAYVEALTGLIKERRPKLVILGHTSMGMELAPSLAIRLGMPLATDCVKVELAEGRLKVTRQLYGGKVMADLVLREAEGYIVTLRPGAVGPAKPRQAPGKVVKVDVALSEPKAKRTVGYIEPPPTEVDITKSSIIVSVGRGIKDAKNIPIVEELAKMMGGVLACSRPIVDKGWLPKDRQVGSSGKTVKPKLYLALGISGAFQHVMGMKDSELIIAVNKDPNAPIFNVAHYGVVDDLFKVVEALKEQLRKLKA